MPLMPKLWLGPVSHMVIEFFRRNPNLNIGMIPSDNQINSSNSYVRVEHHPITTKDLVRLCPNTKIMRDHGSNPYELIEDYKAGIRMFHIDSFKLLGQSNHVRTKDLINLINILHISGNLCQFEVGTEEYIFSYRKNGFDEIRFKFLEELNKFDIQYFVIQGGTNISKNRNIGSFNELEFSEQIESIAATREYLFKNETYFPSKKRIKTKEHNGDFLSDEQLVRRFELGLDAINVAPELGYLQTKYALELDVFSSDDIAYFVSEIIKSGKWKRWMGSDKFDLSWSNKDLFLSCGHYVWQDFFSNLEPTKWEMVYNKLSSEIIRKYKLINGAKAIT